MDYSLNVKRLRMKVVLDSIDGGGGVGMIELRDDNRVILATLLLAKPSFYLVGDALQLTGPTSAFVAIAGQATIATISDSQGNVVIDDMTVGVDITEDETHDFEICLDTTALEIGKQVTIVYATIEHG